MSSITVLSFSSPGCGPCRSLKPILDQLAQTGVNVTKIDVTENSELAAKLHVDSVPSTFIFQDDVPVLNFVGVANLKAIQRMIRQVKNGEHQQEHEHHGHGCGCSH